MKASKKLIARRAKGGAKNSDERVRFANISTGVRAGIDKSSPLLRLDKATPIGSFKIEIDG